VLPRALRSLLPEARLVGPSVEITGITASSAAVRPGDLFAALPGRIVHGAHYIQPALVRGAVAVLTDPAGAAAVPADVPALIVDDVRAVLGPVAAEVYGRPSERARIIGITGTSGKTTTSFLVRAGLDATGVRTGLIGTVATYIGTEQLQTGFTTPEAPELQALFALMLEQGVQTVVMEVSSHALAMGRVDGTGFAAGAFTNLSQDHLDFHTDMEDYFAAKARLFDGRSRVPVVVVDDEWGTRLAAGLPDAVTVSTDGAATARSDWQAREITQRADGSLTFQALGPGVDLAAGCAIPGSYNVANALLALAVLDAVGVPAEKAVAAVASATVPGRMERIDAGQPFLAVVDYSHKPAAVAGALAALRPLTTGRLTIVLGCGGDRDRAKRPLMGAIAARDADRLIITDDNPRSEDPAEIRREMLLGAQQVDPAQRATIEEIGDRAGAIAAAVATAQPGDTVLIAGKGHETGQEVMGQVTPFDDRQVLRAVLPGRPT
jgi:UDP-N-acetylmuramoyl-L-alanyl-D-glutamate--2,6-diaminopimelate ligase